MQITKAEGLTIQQTVKELRRIADEIEKKSAFILNLKCDSWRKVVYWGVDHNGWEKCEHVGPVKTVIRIDWMPEDAKYV